MGMQQAQYPLTSRHCKLCLGGRPAAVTAVAAEACLFVLFPLFSCRYVCEALPLHRRTVGVYVCYPVSFDSDGALLRSTSTPVRRVTGNVMLLRRT